MTDLIQRLFSCYRASYPTLPLFKSSQLAVQLFFSISPFCPVCNISQWDIISEVVSDEWKIANPSVYKINFDSTNYKTNGQKFQKNGNGETTILLFSYNYTHSSCVWSSILLFCRTLVVIFSPISPKTQDKACSLSLVKLWQFSNIPEPSISVTRQTSAKFWIHISKDKSDILEFLVGVCQPHASFILLKPPCNQLPVQEEHNAGADEDRSNFSSDGLFSQPVAFCSWVVIREEMKPVWNNLACTYTVTESFFLGSKNISIWVLRLGIEEKD